MSVAEITGANIRRARLARGWTQRQLAEKIGHGCEARLVNRWENGHGEPSPKYRQGLVDVLFEGDLSTLYRTPEAALT